MKFLFQKQNIQEVWVWRIVGFMVLSNIFFLSVHTVHKFKTKFDFYYEPGYHFNVFKDKVKGQKYVGYLTNKDMSRQKNDGFFMQAQYFLAPTILDLNNYDSFDLNLIDIPEEIFIFYTLKKTKSKRIDHNEYGQALIERIDAP